MSIKSWLVPLLISASAFVVTAGARQRVSGCCVATKPARPAPTETALEHQGHVDAARRAMALKRANADRWLAAPIATVR